MQLALDYKMLALGAQGMAFSTIVAAGENGSLPHAVPGDRVIELGDMVTMDFGAKVDGYCADMTRTVAVGKPSDKMRKNLRYCPACAGGRAGGHRSGPEMLRY